MTRGTIAVLELLLEADGFRASTPEVAAQVRESPQTAMRVLRRLAEDGRVTVSADGKRRVYTLHPEHVQWAQQQVADSQVLPSERKRRRFSERALAFQAAAGIPPRAAVQTLPGTGR